MPDVINFNTIRSFFIDKPHASCYYGCEVMQMKKEFHPGTPPCTVENIDIVSVIRNKDYRHSYKNGRGKHGFVYVLHGRMRDDFIGEREKEIELSAGDLVFIPKGCAYFGNYLEDGTEIRIIQFDLASGTLPPYLSEPTKIELPDAGECMGAFFDTAPTSLQSAFYYLACIYDLLRRLDALYSRLPAKYARIKRALTYIAEHPQENLSVSYYARLSNMSEVGFRRLFREYTGKSPIDYRNALRLESARVRLQSGEYNVSEAAESVGFSNLSFFIRLYKKQYGHTPKKE